MDSERAERAALLEGNDSDDDGDFFLHGPTSSTNAIRKQLDEVKEIARDNITRMADREARLSNLDERSERLDMAASEFRAGATHLKRRQWWEHSKVKAVGASMVGILLFLVIIIIIANQG